MRLHPTLYMVTSAHREEMIMVNRETELVGIRGWLLVYVVALGLLTVHAIGLTVASVIVYDKPATAGLATVASLKALSPLSSVLFYVITNVLLIIYAVVLYILMFRRRKAAISNNVTFNALSVLLLVVWHFAGEKSNVGTFVDALPNLVSLWYFLVSRRVRNTFTIG
jgi:Protein of unknown function (DUF2569)